MRRYRWVTLVVLALWLPGAAQTELTPAEVAGRRRIAGAWVEAGRWCVTRKLGAEARACLEQALAADPGVRGLADLEQDATACPEAASEASHDAWERRHTSVRHKVAGYLDRLHAALVREEALPARERGADYLWQALELEPTARRWTAALLELEQALETGGDAQLLRRIEQALALDPPAELVERLERAWDRAAVDQVVLRRATTHPICYYLSLPRDHGREGGRRWPVLLCVDGAGSNFEGLARGYQRQRGDLPLIIVSPCTFSNTNKLEGKLLERYREYYGEEVIAEGSRGRLRWDEQGVLAILSDLRQHHDAEERVHVTGFSGGGNVAYMMIFTHPDLVNGAAPACANFGRPDYAQLQGAFPAEALAFPVHLITGAEDPHRQYTHGNPELPGIEPQTDLAQQVLEALGYPSWKRTMVPGLKHSPAHRLVLDTLRPYILGQKPRSAPLE